LAGLCEALGLDASVPRPPDNLKYYFKHFFLTAWRVHEILMAEVTFLGIYPQVPPMPLRLLIADMAAVTFPGALFNLCSVTFLALQEVSRLRQILEMSIILLFKSNSSPRQTARQATEHQVQALHTIQPTIATAWTACSLSTTWQSGDTDLFKPDSRCFRPRS